MQFTSALAIYFLFWVLTGLAMLPFGFEPVPRDDPDYVPGQAESAPRHFRPRRVILRTTIVATALFALFFSITRWAGSGSRMSTSAAS